MEKRNLLLSYDTPYHMARAYYDVVLRLSGVEVTEGELNLLAFSAVYGTFSTPPVRNLFMQTFGVSKSRVGNLLSSLIKKKGLMVKDEQKKVRLHPQLRMDFTGDAVVLQVGLKLDKTKTDGE